jgi:hypothetical protein
MVCDHSAKVSIYTNSDKIDLINNIITSISFVIYIKIILCVLNQ